MTTNRIDPLLAEVFAGMFIGTSTSRNLLPAKTLEDWDSLKHLEINFEDEAATGLVFSEEQIMAIKSIDNLRRMRGTLHAS